MPSYQVSYRPSKPRFGRARRGWYSRVLPCGGNRGAHVALAPAGSRRSRCVRCDAVMVPIFGHWRSRHTHTHRRRARCTLFAAGNSALLVGEEICTPRKPFVSSASHRAAYACMATPLRDMRHTGGALGQPPTEAYDAYAADTRRFELLPVHTAAAAAQSTMCGVNGFRAPSSPSRSRCFIASIALFSPNTMGMRETRSRPSAGRSQVVEPARRQWAPSTTSGHKGTDHGSCC